MMLFVQPLISYTMQLNTDFIIHYLPEYFSGIKNYIVNLEEIAAQTINFLRMDTIGDLTFNLFLLALIPAIGEEMLFRGVLQQKLQSILRNPHIAITITAFIFSAIMDANLIIARRNNIIQSFWGVSDIIFC